MVNSCTAIIQARIGAERFYGKVLKSLPFNSNLCILDQIVIRVKAAGIENIIIATSTNKKDSDIIAHCEKMGYKYFQGNEENVLKRFYDTAVYNDCINIIRVTADNPFIDPIYMKDSVSEFINNSPEYFATRGLPLGTNFEIFTFKTLEKCFKEAKEKYDTENVTSYIYNNPKFFKIQLKKYDFDKKELRLTVDTKNDYLFACSVYELLYQNNNLFGLKEILELFNTKPYIFEINNNITQKRQITDLNDEIKFALEILKPYELKNVEELLKKRWNNISFFNYPF